MSFFNLFGTRSDINTGVEEYRKTPDAVLLDVRTPGEYREGHIPDSVNLPLDQISGISCSKNAPLFVYCWSGSRSRQATNWLKQNGYDARNIGGIMRYRGTME